MTLSHELQAADASSVRDTMMGVLCTRDPDFVLGELERAKRYPLLREISESFEELCRSFEATGKAREDLLLMRGGVTLAIISIAQCSDLQIPDFPSTE